MGITWVYLFLEGTLGHLFPAEDVPTGILQQPAGALGLCRPTQSRKLIQLESHTIATGINSTVLSKCVVNV